MSRLLIAIGVASIALGIGWPLLRRAPLFHLPGDFVVDRPGFRFYFPFTSMLLISVLISLIAWALRK